MDDLLRLIEEAASAHRRFVTPGSDAGAAVLALDTARGRLEAQIKVDRRFHMPDEEYLVLGGESFQIGPGLWAAWAGARAVEAGAERALTEINRYLESTDIPCQRVLALKGIALSTPLELDGGISLVPFSSLENPFETRLQIAGTGYSLHRMPHSALIVERVATKSGVPPSKLNPAADQDLWDAALCLTLVGPSAPMPVATWYVLPDWVPRWGMGTTSWDVPGLLHPFKLEKQHYSEARAVHERFTKCEEDFRRRLRIPVARLRSAIRELNPVDAAIDLGIAMEATFLLPEERDELRYRLAVRAGWYLGEDNADTRKDTFQLFHDLYKLRSDAVHTGQVPSRYRGQSTYRLLEQGFARVAEALRRVIRSGAWPDWESVVFG